MKAEIAVAIVFACLTCLFGCGGANLIGTAPTPVTISVPVDWPVRTMAVEAPSSASSVSFLMHDPTGRQVDVSFSGNRAANISAHTETYPCPTSLLPGRYVLSGMFYTGVNQGGLEVATFSAPVDVNPSGNLVNGVGGSLGPIKFDGVVKSVSIPAGQTVSLGSSAQIQASALDANNSPIALSPGSTLFAVTSGSANLSVTPSGLATGLGFGNALVTATVDSVTSYPATVTVPNPNAPPDFQNPGFEIPAIPSGTFTAPFPAGSFWTGPSVPHGAGMANGYGSWGTGAEAGQQYAFLQSANNGIPAQGFCQQTVAGFVVGHSYKVTFYMAARSGDVGGDTGIAVSLTANGTEIFPPTAPNPDYSWNQYSSVTFNATQTSYTFMFSTPPAPPGQDASTLLDEVHVVAVQ